MERIDCPHDGRHKHGTTTAYNKDKCRCDDCRRVHARKLKEYQLRKHHGMSNTRRDAADVIEHMDTLKKHGYRPIEIARDAGLSEMTVHRIYREGRCSEKTARRVLAVEIPATPITSFDSWRVDVHGTRLRLQALHAIGYPIKTLGKSIDMKENGVHRIINPEVYQANRYVTTEVRRRVIALYDYSWDKPPKGDTPMQQRAIDNSIRSAAEKGWVPPFGLDEDRIDDPTYRPNPNDNIHRKAS